MKTKLSLLALPLCLGLCACLVLTIALANCTGDGPTKTTSSSSGGEYLPSSDSPGVPGVIEIFDFNVNVYDNYYATLEGRVEATRDTPVVKLEFRITNLSWIKWKGGAVDGPISLNAKSVNLSDVMIDFENPVPFMPCQEDIWITVEATNLGGKKASASGKFQRPKFYCDMSSSSEGGGASSSSVGGWEFGAPISGTIEATTPGVSNPINIGSGKIELWVEGSFTDGQPDVIVTGGRIREAEPCSDDIKQNTPYSSEDKCLGSDPATKSKLSEANCAGQPCVIAAMQYYLVYMDDNSIYLVQFAKSEGLLFARWPKKYTYWPATKSP